MKKSKDKDQKYIQYYEKNPNNNIIQKSRPLVSLWRSNLSLAEFKILDMYLSRINSREPENRVVTFEKGEIEKCLGVSRIRTEVLVKRLVNLGQGIKINDDESENGFQIIWLFEHASCKKDKFGTWTVKLECSSKAMDYFFNIENIGYLRYKLRCISGLTSRYSYILFLYLESNRFRKKWEIEVNELKEILNCNKEASYSQFKRFHDSVLKRCHRELNEKTECKFTYEPIKNGKYVVSIRFTLYSLSKIDISEDNSNLINGWPFEKYKWPQPDKNDTFIVDVSDDECYSYSSETGFDVDDTISFLQDACIISGTNKPEFSRIEMEEIFSVLVEVPENILPVNTPTDSLDIRRFHYLREKYTRMNRFAQHKPIKHRVSYFIKIIQNDCK